MLKVPPKLAANLGVAAKIQHHLAKAETKACVALDKTLYSVQICNLRGCCYLTADCVQLWKSAPK